MASKQIFWDLKYKKALHSLLNNADFLFHCAGGKEQTELMNDINVKVQKKIHIEAESNLQYFSHISSHGV